MPWSKPLGSSSRWYPGKRLVEAARMKPQPNAAASEDDELGRASDEEVMEKDDGLLPQDVHFEGHLEKQPGGRGGSTFLSKAQRRFFVLDGGTLSWYVKKGAYYCSPSGDTGTTKPKAKNSIDLNCDGGGYLVVPNPSSGPAGRRLSDGGEGLSSNTFSLANRDGTNYVLTADSAEEKQGWVDALNCQLELSSQASRRSMTLASLGLSDEGHGGRRRSGSADAVEGESSPSCGSVAVLEVGVIRGSGLASRRLMNRTSRAFAVVRNEGVSRQTEIVQSEDPQWQVSTFTFHVHDVTGSVNITVMCDKTVGKPVAIGRVIVPLSDLLPPVGLRDALLWTAQEARFAATPASATAHPPPPPPSPVSTEPGWYELLPLPECEAKFSSVVDGVNSSGMRRPACTCGVVQLSFKLTLLRSLPYCLAAVAPLSESGVGPDPDHLDPRWLKGAKPRLKSIAAPPWMLTLARAASWKSVPLSVSTVGSLCLGSLYVPMWMMPVACAAGMAALSVTGRPPLRPGLHDGYEVRIWNDEVDRDQNNSVLKKLEKLKGVVTTLQNLACAAASGAEKSRSSLAWDEPGVTAMLLGFQLLVGATSSIVLRVLTAIMAPRKWACLFFLLMMSPPAVRGAVLRKKRTNEEGEEGQQGVQSGNNVVGPKAVAKMLFNGVRNLMARLPNQPEIVHRQIARSQLLALGDKAPPPHLTRDGTCKRQQ